jgi:hypothetical protein
MLEVVILTGAVILGILPGALMIAGAATSQVWRHRNKHCHHWKCIEYRIALERHKNSVSAQR